ncbi:hypothetical protein CANARDRAFT_26970 [[Candida] arabinofermentans NRRL YB-2248]|uniref:SMP-LTD domain-containing protein n=1 Tax=[Candida] arabinofermentans NRRL YB-2248 TaxID=983967 RepID=A0A1E4T750_9ASCO|nr:hypothetical protein CANARDRAFT_26970 [[Candida] arabinofermentans NRRL YB-2248]
MHWLLGVILTYVIGGLTFIPLILLSVWYFSSKAVISPEMKTQLEWEAQEKKSELKGETPGYRSLKVGEIIEKENINVKAYYSGWLTVTREYYQFPQMDPNSFNALSHQAASSLTDTENVHAGTTGSGGGGLFKIMKSTSSSIMSVPEDQQHDPASLDAKKLKAIRKKNRYFAVLKHGNLFLYQDEEQKNVQHVIVLANHTVAIWPRDLRDGQLFTRRSSICIMKKENPYDSKGSSDGTPYQNTIDILRNSTKDSPPPKNSYFVYGDMNHQKEDWYFALLRATTTSYVSSGTDRDLLEPSVMAEGLHFFTADMIDLIQTLNSSEGQLSTKWLNAIIGRFFLSAYRTEEFKSLVKDQVVERLKKIRTPGFLDDLRIESVDVGHSAPFITYPKLNSLSPEGDLEVEFNFLYQGALTIEVATKIFLNLGARFKQREFDINLKIQVLKIQGDIVAKFKPNPTSRIWYAFKKMPTLDMAIEPVFSSRIMNYNLVTNIITNKFKDAIKNSIVLPFMDDFVLYKTVDEIFRGGVWNKANRSTSLSQSAMSSIGSRDDISSIPPPIPTRETPLEEALLQAFDNKSVLSENKEQPIEVTYADESPTQPPGLPSAVDSALTTESIGTISSTESTSRFKSKATQLSKRASSLLEKRLNSSSDSIPAFKDDFAQTTSKSSSTSVSHDSDIHEKTAGSGASSKLKGLKGWYSSSKQKLTDHKEEILQVVASPSQTKENTYNPPEMISSRRVVRKSQPVATTNNLSPPTHKHQRQPSLDNFTKGSESTALALNPDSASADPVTPTSPTMFINDRFRAVSMGSAISHNSTSTRYPVTTSVKTPVDTRELNHDEVRAALEGPIESSASSDRTTIDPESMREKDQKVVYGGPLIPDSVDSATTGPPVQSLGPPVSPSGPPVLPPRSDSIELLSVAAVPVDHDASDLKEESIVLKPSPVHPVYAPDVERRTAPPLPER